MQMFFIYAGLIFSMVIWSLTFIWTRQLLECGLHPIAIIFLRLSIATIIMVPVLFFQLKNITIRKKDVHLFVLMALLEPFLYFLFETNGIRYVSPTVASLMIATIPVVLAILSRILLNERLRWLNYSGFFISMAGVMLILYQPDASWEATFTGILLLSGAVLSASFYNILARKLLISNTPFLVTSAKIVLGWGYFAIPFIMMDAKPSLTQLIQVQIIIPLAALGLLGNLIAYFLYNRALQHLGATRSSIFANFIPALTALFSFYLLDEDIGIHKIAAIILIIAGVMLTQRNHK